MSETPAMLYGLGERIRNRLTAPFVIAEQEVVLSASIGIALSTTPCTEAGDLLRDADIAMHRAKHAGKARSRHNSPLLVEVTNFVGTTFYRPFERADSSGTILFYFYAE